MAPKMHLSQCQRATRSEIEVKAEGEEEHQFHLRDHLLEVKAEGEEEQAKHHLHHLLRDHLIQELL